MRPRFHYAPAANWLSDPNGLVHWAGEWHLFYQYNPQGEDWGHMAWGHAVSRDLANWTELPPALVEDAQFMIFSGSAVVDRADSAGFGRDALIALYTGAACGEPGRQAQCLASSSDQGRTWTKFPGNPVLDRGLADFRDPNVFWHAPTCRWIMTVVLSDRNTAVLYASDNLRDWTELSQIGPWDAPGEIWECPLLIELPVEGSSERRWMFKVDVLRGAPGSGAIYRTGTFDGCHFEPDGDAWQVADWGSDFYAAIAWHEPRDAAGRPLWIGWLGNHAYQGQLPDKGWRGAMSLPRRIALRRDAASYWLTQQVEPAAVASARQLPLHGPDCPGFGRFDLPAGTGCRLVLSDGSGRELIVERQGERVQLTRRDPTAPYLDAVQSIRLDRGIGLTGWLDGGSLELVSGDGSVTLSVQHLLFSERLTIAFDQAD